MSENTINVYEGLFLFPQAAGSNLGEAADHVQDLLSKSGAEVLSFSKWEERRLAYEIKGHKRGVFFLGGFFIGFGGFGSGASGVAPHSGLLGNS